jgi:hypothetical protein
MTIYLQDVPEDPLRKNVALLTVVSELGSTTSKFATPKSKPLFVDGLTKHP